jgi:hypothetical protein
MQTKRNDKFLKDIAKLIINYEDPTGHNCSNDIMAEIIVDFGRKTEKKYSFNGESFVECDK